MENTERIIPIDILLICGMAHGPNLKDFDIRQSSRIRINVRGNAEGEMLMQDEKDGEIRAVIPVRPSADWQEKSGEFHIETSVRALYFTYRGSGSIDWQWV